MQPDMLLKVFNTLGDLSGTHFKNYRWFYFRGPWLRKTTGKKGDVTDLPRSALDSQPFKASFSVGKVLYLPC